MKIKKIMALIMASAMMLSMAACGGAPATSDKGETTPTDTTTPAADPATTPDATTAEVPPDADQYLNYSMDAEPSSMDASKSSDMYSGTIMIDVFEPLCRLEDTESGVNETKPAGAESWTTSDDGLVWTFKIRDNNWSDGVPVTAKDYAYGITRTADPKTGSPNSFFLSCLKNANDVLSGAKPLSELGVKVVDDKTLELTLDRPTPWLLGIAYQKAMMPQRQDIVEKHGEKYGAELETLVFNGPFAMTKWTHNSEIELSKNEQYWDKDSVKLGRVNYKILTDENAWLNSLDNGSIDSAGVRPKEWIDRFAKKEDMHFVSYPRPQSIFNFYNVTDPIMQNVNMRKAITMGIDLTEFNEVVYKGVNTPAFGFVPPAVDMGNLGEFRTLVPEPLKKLKEETPDAKVLLLKGMEELGLGTDPSTVTIKLAVGGTDQWYRTFGEYMQQALKKSLGINLEIQFYEWGTFESKVSKGDYQIGNMAWMIDYNEPMSMLELLKSNSTAVVTNWANPKYDELIDKAGLEQDDTKRMALYAEAEKIALYDDCILSPMVFTNTSAYRYNYVKGVPTNTFTGYGMGLKHAYTAGR